MKQRTQIALPPAVLTAVAITVAVLAGCSSAYYSAWEMLGQEKRDLLRSNVESVKQEQQAAADDFEDALERLRSLYDIDGGKLENRFGHGGRVPSCPGSLCMAVWRLSWARPV